MWFLQLPASCAPPRVCSSQGPSAVRHEQLWIPWPAPLSMLVLELGGPQAPSPAESKPVQPPPEASTTDHAGTGLTPGSRA